MSLLERLRSARGRPTDRGGCWHLVNHLLLCSSHTGFLAFLTDKHNPAIGPLHMLFLLQENHKAHALIFFRSLLTCYLIRDTLMA